MSLKITIEVDGQTEQQVAPVIGQIVARHPELLSGTPHQKSLPNQDLYYENSALLQQQIQQLTIQNKLLESQVASQHLLPGGLPNQALTAQGRQSPQGAGAAEDRWPSGHPKQAISASAVTAPDSGPESNSRTPVLPVQYRPSKGAVARYLLRRSLTTARQRLWQLLTWISFGKEWLAVFLLLSGGMYAARMLVPKVVDRFQDQPEFVDSVGSGPGAAASKSTSEEAADPSADKPADDKPAADTADSSDKTPTAPSSPSSKAGSNPAPPAAFQ